MSKNSKRTKNGIAIIHRRYYEGKPPECLVPSENPGSRRHDVLFCS